MPALQVQLQVLLVAVHPAAEATRGGALVLRLVTVQRGRPGERLAADVADEALLGVCPALVAAAAAGRRSCFLSYRHSGDGGSLQVTSGHQVRQSRARAVSAVTGHSEAVRASGFTGGGAAGGELVQPSPQ